MLTWLSVILYYDYLLTLPSEVERYWSRGFSVTISGFFFFFCRYMALLGNIPVIIQTAWSVQDALVGIRRASSQSNMLISLKLDVS